MHMTVGEIVKACGGKLLCGDPATVVTGVETDSRQIRPGDLFVPLRGERVDAHVFIPATFAAGAAAVLTQEHATMQAKHAWIAVPDTAKALQALATAYRRRFQMPLIGITGSVGKTTTKEMVALALSAGLNVMKTQGNQNSQVGVPLTMFQLDASYQAGVIEMGMSQFGEMARLASIVAPQYAVMTNIGISHIENLHTQDNILREKLHITDGFGPDSILVLNGEDPMLAGLRGQLPFRTVFVGMHPWCDYRATDLVSHDGTMDFTAQCPGMQVPVHLPVLGAHQVTNALAALAIADILHVDLQAAAAALANYQPLAMRQQVHHVDGITIIDDTYNASPDAMRSSVDVLCAYSGRHVAVLGDMLELGTYSEQARFSCGEHAALAGVDLLVTVGPAAAAIGEGARSVRPQMACRHFETNREAAEYLRQALTAGDVVLVKGSRGMHMEEIISRLISL